MSDNKKNTIIFFGAIIVFIAINYIFCSRFKINDSNLYLYMSSYKDGFCSAGLIGTIFQFICNISGADVASYEVIYRFCKFSLVLYFIIYMAFIISAYCRGRNAGKEIRIMTVVLVCLTSSMFCTSNTLGSADMYMAMVLIFSLILLMNNITPLIVGILTIIGVLIHPAYLIKCLPVIIVYMIYKALTKDKKYMYYTIAITASAIAIVIIGEITGGKVEGLLHIPDWDNVASNVVSLIIYILLMTPYILIMHLLHKDILRTADNARKKVYNIIRWGALPVAIGFILKSDYGNMVYFTLIYYLAITVMMLVSEDKYYIESFNKILDGLKRRIPAAEVLLIYPVLMIPITNRGILSICDNITDLII